MTSSQQKRSFSENHIFYRSNIKSVAERCEKTSIPLYYYWKIEWKEELWAGFLLTDQHRHQQAGQPLLLHLLDHGLLPRRRGFAHHRQRIDVRHGAHRGGGEPRQAEERADGAEHDDEQQVQVEAGAFHQAALLLTDDQPESRKAEKNEQNWQRRQIRAEKYEQISDKRLRKEIKLRNILENKPGKF